MRSHSRLLKPLGSRVLRLVGENMTPTLVAELPRGQPLVFYPFAAGKPPTAENSRYCWTNEQLRTLAEVFEVFGIRGDVTRATETSGQVASKIEAGCRLAFPRAEQHLLHALSDDGRL